jgi:hypothetical protein
MGGLLAPVFYVCENSPADEIVATFMQSDLPYEFTCTVKKR